MDPNSAEGKHLMAFIERIERVNEEIKGLSDDRKEIYAEAKSTGYNVAIMREIVKIRAMDQDERHEKEALLATYMAGVGLDA